MSGYDLGTIRGTIDIEFDDKGTKRATEELEKLGDSSERSSSKLDKLSRGAGVAGVVLAGGLAVAAKSAADFEQKLSAVKAVSGASESEMDSLRAKALQLGKETAFSASESSTAIEELVKAGLSVKDVLNGAADATVNLAAAGEIALPEAATIASNAMNQFGLKAEDMVNVTDKIAGAANASAIDVGDFGMSLQQAGAVANLAGVSFDDTAVAIALMGNAGIKGSDAGTSLKSMFSRLQPTTEKQISLMKELGLITKNGSNQFYDASGNMRSLSEVSGVLSKSLAGMSAQQKQAALQTIFGQDAIRSAAILADNGSKGFDKMAASMGKVSAADVASTRMDNLKGATEELMGTVETLAITVGTPLLGALTSVADTLNKVVSTFLALPGPVQKGITVFIAIVAASLLALAAFVKITNFLKAVKVAFVAVRSAAIPAWLAALGPVALVIAAIAAVVAIVILLWKKSETFRTIVLAVWGAIKTGISAVVSWFTGTLVPAFKSVWEKVSSAASTAWDAVSSVVSTVLGVIITLVKSFVAVVLAPWKALWSMFGPLVKASFGVVLAVIKLVWTVIKTIFLANLRIIKAAISVGFRAMKAVIGAVMGVIRAVIGAVWGAIGGKVKAAVGLVKSVVTAAWNAVKRVTITVWNALKPAISAAISGVMKVVNSIKDKVLRAVDFVQQMKDKGKAIIQGIINGITSKINGVKNAMGAVGDAVAGFLPGSPVREGPLKVINHGYAGRRIIGDVLEGMVSMRKPVSTIMGSILEPGSGLATAGSPLSSVSFDAPQIKVATASPARSGSGSGGNLRLVQGRLSIDNSGSAWIKGLVEEVVDSDEDQSYRRSGMGSL